MHGLVDDDFAAWARMIAAARAQAEAPDRVVKALNKASRRGPTVPVGFRVIGSDFHELFKLAQTFAGLHGTQRPAAAVRLSKLADACAGHLDTLRTGSRRRADIDD